MNRLCELLGVDLPLVQAPMAGVQGGTLAVAVASAGGLGSLPCAMLGIEGVRAEVAAIRARSERPLNLNFFCHERPAPDAEREAAWREVLAPYYEELGVEASDFAPGPSREPFDEAMANLVSELRPEVVSFHFGLPAEPLMAKVRACGAKVLSSATTVAEARWLEERGVDAVIAQGSEAGGHRGCFLESDVSAQLETVALVPQLVDVLKVPVIAAGGIADARGVAAAMALGAGGVQVGTAYLLCPEAKTSAVHRAALQSEAARVTALTNVLTGRWARGIVNRAMRELGPVSDRVPAFPIASAAMAPLRRKAEAGGSGDFSPLWAGQNASACQERAAAEVTRALASALEH